MFVYTLKDIFGLALLAVLLVCGGLICAAHLWNTFTGWMQRR